jgi:hypothetical protein
VTFAEAFAMLVRALKLDKAAVGVWPANYMLVAAHIGLDKGLDPVANLAMTRGEMAVAAENGVKSEWKWNAEDEELVEAPTGFESLLQKYWEDAWEKYVTEKKVTGVFERVTAAKELRVSGKNYVVESETNLVIAINGSDETTKGVTHLGSLVNAKKVEEDDNVLLTLNPDGKVTKIEFVLDTHANVKLTKVVVEENETDFGTINLPGATGLKVDGDTDILLDGKDVTLAGLKKARDAFVDKWAQDPIATVRTEGNVTGNDKPAIWISVITTKTVSGEITAKGADKDGNFVRIDGTKYYWAVDPGQPGNTITVLLGHDGEIYVVLDEVLADEFFAKVLYHETYTKDGATKVDATFELADGKEKKLTVTGASIDVVKGNVNKVVHVKVEAGGAATVEAAVDHRVTAADRVYKDSASTWIETGTTKYVLDGNVFYYNNDTAKFIARGDLVKGADQVALYAIGGVVGYVVVDATAPTALTAVAANGTGTAGTKDAGDRVTITFSEATNQPAITNANINTVLALSAGKSWLDGAGAIGSAVWTSATVLTITLSGGGTPPALPTVDIGDVITPSSAITDLAGRAATGTVTITGAW